MSYKHDSSYRSSAKDQALFFCVSRGAPGSIGVTRVVTRHLAQYPGAAPLKGNVNLGSWHSSGSAGSSVDLLNDAVYRRVRANRVRRWLTHSRRQYCWNLNLLVADSRCAHSAITRRYRTWQQVALRNRIGRIRVLLVRTLVSRSSMHSPLTVFN